MKKLILKMSVSIDGFVRGSKGESEWTFRMHGDDATTLGKKTGWILAPVLGTTLPAGDVAKVYPRNAAGRLTVVNPNNFFSQSLPILRGAMS